MACPTLDELPPPPSGKTGWPWTEQSDPLPETRPDGSPWPKISIVTPSYNQGRFIEETIRSILLQGYPNLEYIVMDGGSDDETVSILEKYDPWIDYWVSEADEGQSDAINRGLRRTTGDMVAWINSDDYYAPRAFVTMAQAYAEHENEVGAFVGTGHKVNRDGEIVYTPSDSPLTHEAFLQWLNGGSFMQPACFFKREAWAEHGPLRTDLHYAMDIDLFLKMSQSYTFKRVDETISYAHKHDAAKTTGERQRWRAEVILRLFEYGGDDAAHPEAMKVADELSTLKGEMHAMNRHHIFKWAMRLWRRVIQ
jgi:glycosyltransferase involved in cell wall biosynthesis